MKLQISVRNYRGIERADIALDPICLAAGRNEQGKSSLAQAARAVLSGEAIPIPGVAKKDAKLLVRDGAEEGHVKATAGERTALVTWPKADVHMGETNKPGCSPYAVGLQHLFDLDAKERARVLGLYIDAEPSQKDLAAAMADLGYAEPAIKQTWQAVSKPGGWDATWKKAREHTTKLKGQWEAVTGEKYGAKKAQNWQPKEWPGTEAKREALQAAIEQAQAQVKETVGSAAVSAAELERLRAEADAKLDDPKALRETLEAARSALTKAEAERLQLPVEGKGANTLCACPACGAELVVEPLWQGPTVLKIHSAQAAEEAASREVQKRRSALDGEIARLKGVLMTLTPQASRLELAHEHAEMARKRLASLNEQGPGHGAEAIAAAEQAAAQARAALAAFDAKANAERLHATVVKHDALAAILAPDGLRRRKLAAGLETFNTRLATLCASAKWLAVRLDEELKPHYGTRAVWAASSSGQWRARVVVQIAMAQMDGSTALVIDEADILDARGRNGLFALLKAAGLKALICMTINKPALVPDLAAAGLGQSVWIDSGLAEVIETRAAATA